MGRRELAYEGDADSEAEQIIDDGADEGAGSDSDGAGADDETADVQTEESGSGDDDGAGFRATLEALLDPEQQPDWLRGMAKVAEAEGIDSFNVKLEDIEDSDARRYLFDASRWLHRLGSETGREREVLRSERLALQAERAELAQREAEMLKLFSHPALREAINIEDKDVDPLSPEGLEQSSRKAASDVMAAFLDKFEEAKKAREEEAAKAKAEAAAAQEREAMLTFARSKPDFREHYDEIKRLYESSSLSLEECYDIARMKAGKVDAPAPDPRAASRRAMGRSRGKRSEGPPKNATPEELVRWMRQNPDAAAAHVQSIFSGPNGYRPT